MSKPLMIVGILIAITIAAGIGAYLWWQDLKVQAEESRKEAVEFAKGAKQSDCLSIVAFQALDCSSFTCLTKNKTFLQACLSEAKQGKDVCKTAPLSTDKTKSDMWIQATCESHDSAEEACYEIMKDVLLYCDVNV